MAARTSLALRGRSTSGTRSAPGRTTTSDSGPREGVVRVGVVGYGYWGPNLVRNLVEYPGSAVTAVADLNEVRLDGVQARYPGVRITQEFRDLLEDPEIDAIAVATPVHSHFDLALAALQAGKHVLVEKPLAASSAQAELLVGEAERRGLQLMVDHTFLYTGAVRRIRDLVRAGELGEIYYLDSVRVNLGLFQHDVDVLWDLAVHDLSIMDFVLARSPVAGTVRGPSTAVPLADGETGAS